MDALVLAMIVIVVIVLATIFAFTNGYNDTAASVGTLIASGAATPESAVIYASITGLLGTLLGGSAVVLTITSLVSATGETLVVVLLAGVASAIVWNVASSKAGLPSSSTFAFVGGFIGAGVAAGGIDSVLWGVQELFSSSPQLVGVTKVFIFLIASVAIGFVGGFLAMKFSRVALRNADKSVNKGIRRWQWVTSGLLSFAHGANDPQKQMTIIAMAMFGAGYVATIDASFWMRARCAVALAVGTLGGGWKIMRTMGRGIYKIRPIHSLDAQATSAFSIIVSTLAGAPISSTQVVSSAVIGVGAAENARMVQWRVGQQMIVSWFITIPVTMVIAGAAFIALKLLLLGG
ncbi:MAG: inorganic phosphate transporter [Methanomassiliicoccales archaeon]|nr:inorganic phosphate transporter [Methanomassiliicoccales archaeon]